jgi:hypothetical protein
VDIDAKDPAQSLTETQKEVGDGVFSARNSPVRLSVKVRQLPAWRAEDGSANPVPQSPVTSDQPIENATPKLVKQIGTTVLLGCSRAMFPRLSKK